MTPLEVIGVGDADVDIFMDVDHIPGRDEKVLAKRVEYYAGGMVANFICALSRLGTRCGFHGPVGDDEFGRVALENFRANGVDTAGTFVKKGGRTYYCVVMLDESGEKALIIVPTDCNHPTADELDEEQIARARHMHMTGSVSTMMHAVELAKKHDLSVSLDLESLTGLTEADLRELLAKVDIAFINQRGAAALVGEGQPEDAARRLVQYGARIGCVTLGEAGSVAASNEELVRAAAFKVEVADSTGAGDCYAAGFVHGFVKGWPLEAMTMLGSAVGALAVTKWGGHSGAPTFAQAVAFLASRGVDIDRLRGQ